MSKKQTTILIAAAIAATTILSVTVPASASTAWTSATQQDVEVVQANFKKKKVFFGHSRGFKGKRFKHKHFYGSRFHHSPKVKFKKKKYFY